MEKEDFIYVDAGINLKEASEGQQIKEGCV